MKKTVLWGVTLVLAAGVAGCGGGGLEAGVPKDAQTGAAPVMPPTKSDMKSVKNAGSKAPVMPGSSRRR